MTLLAIKQTIASLLNKDLSDLIVNGQDLCLIALNQARSSAELAHDFEFNRQFLTLAVDGVTGGDLDDAVLYGTSTLAEIKTVVDICQIDTDGNPLPIEWTTASESLGRQRADNGRYMMRYPSDGQIQAGPRGLSRIVVRNNKLYRFPKDTNPTNTYNLGIEAYVMTPDWDGYSDSLTVTGTLNPNAAGFYTSHGTFDDRALFTNGAYMVIYLRDVGTWSILADGLEFTQVWTPASPITGATPDGVYSVNSGTTGTATVVSSASVSNVWTEKASDYLIWDSIVTLNYRFKTFVPRTEGNLAPPADLAAKALAELVEWDAAKFDANRTHGR